MMTDDKKVIRLPPSEDEEHQAFMQWVQHNPTIKDLIFHIPNEGKRSFYMGKKLQRMGMRKGVSDFFLPLPTKKYHGLWIELKRTRGAKETIEQREWIIKMRQLNYHAEFAYGAEHAIQVIKQYLTT